MDGVVDKVEPLVQLPTVDSDVRHPRTGHSGCPHEWSTFNGARDLAVTPRNPNQLTLNKPICITTSEFLKGKLGELFRQIKALDQAISAELAKALWARPGATPLSPRAAGSTLADKQRALEAISSPAAKTVLPEK
ncbi:unnamed protein product [Leptosia nina]|uniref:Uncharacterized protein n=1 Tax=Leptosia nina TaxID=320188 RepID=A0AAV1JHT1_9NEOP